MELSFTTRRLGDVTILEVAGEIDLASAPQLRSCLIDLVGGGCRSLVIDFSPVDFIDSTGLGVLVGARRRLTDAGGDLALVIPRGHIAELFSITGLAGIFTIAESIDSLAEARSDNGS